MSFDLGGIVIRVDQAKAALAEARAGLQQTQDASAAAAQTIGKLGEAATKAGQDVAYGMKSAAGTVGATGETFSDFFDKLDKSQASMLQRIKGPWENYRADLQAAATLARDNQITTGEYEAELGRLQQRLVGLERYSMTPELKREADALERIQGPLREYEQELRTLDSLLQKERISIDQYNDALSKANTRAQSAGVIGKIQGPVFDPNQSGQKAMTDELRREQQLLDQMAAPMKRYQQDLETLTSLLNKDKISLEQYNTELTKVQKRAESGGLIASVQGPKQQSSTVQAAVTSLVPGGGKEEQGPDRLADLAHVVGSKFGAGGDLLAGLATSGTAATGAIAALAAEVIHLGDEYIQLANKAQKVTDKGGDINKTLEQQFDLSRRLHGSLDTTIELYDSVRDGTDELNISRTRQIGLTREIGQAVLAEGKSLEAAEGLMNRLTFAFANGSIAGRDMRSIMKSFPDIGAAFVETMGHSRQELIAMANKGQISAEMLLDTFHKINKEMAEKSDKQLETSGQRWQHFKDQATLDAKDIGDKAAKGLEIGIGAAYDQTKAAFSVIGAAYDGIFNSSKVKMADDVKRAIAGVNDEYRKQQDELRRLTTGEQERNAKTASIANLSKSLGIDFAPFDEDLANKAGAARLQMSQAGIEIGDVFEAAHGKAQLFGKKLEEIQERKDAEKIAEDVKRIYNALHGADDLLEDQQKRWSAISDEIRTTSEAVLKLQATRFFSGAPQTQDERDLILKNQNAQTSVDVGQYGQKMISYAQGINTARAELERLNAAHRAGVVVDEDYRKQYEGLMTTLNNGRLPETIKLWNDLNLPQQQFMRDNAALDSLLHTGAITLDQYTSKLRELQLAIDKSGLVKLMYEMDDFNKKTQRLVENYEAGRTTMAQDATRYQAGVAHDTKIDTKVADLEKQYQVANLESPDLEKDIEAWNKRVTAIGANLKVLDPLEYAQRQQALRLEQEKKILEQINGAPLKDYKIGIEAAGDLLERGKINAEQYAQAIDATRLAYLQATPAAKTFAGAAEIDWLKAKQGADGLGASIEGTMSSDLGKFNENFITALTGGGPAAQQTRDQIEQLRKEYGKGAVSAEDYAKRYQDLNEQLNAQTDVWANITSSFSSFVDSMIQDIERLLIKWAEMQAVKGIIGLFGGSGGGDATGAATAAIGSLYGFAEGGTGIVGGSGSVDSQVVAFRATPGERLTITPPGAYPYMPASQPTAGSTAGRSAQVVNQIHNHYDTGIVTAGISSGAGQTAVLNVLRANRAAIRATLGIS